MTGAAEPKAVVDRPDSVTHFICPDTSAIDPHDGSVDGEPATHHLGPMRVPGIANVQACLYCGKTEKQLRAELGLA